jgi:hypothetical protein
MPRLVDVLKGRNRREMKDGITGAIRVIRIAAERNRDVNGDIILL